MAREQQGLKAGTALTGVVAIATAAAAVPDGPGDVRLAPGEPRAIAIRSTRLARERLWPRISAGVTAARNSCGSSITLGATSIAGPSRGAASRAGQRAGTTAASAASCAVCSIAAAPLAQIELLARA
jgi:hypothetical protein